MINDSNFGNDASKVLFIIFDYNDRFRIYLQLNFFVIVSKYSNNLNQQFLPSVRSGMNFNFEGKINSRNQK